MPDLSIDLIKLYYCKLQPASTRHTILEEEGKGGRKGGKGTETGGKERGKKRKKRKTTHHVSLSHREYTIDSYVSIL